jgi:hypothetical protein
MYVMRDLGMVIIHGTGCSCGLYIVSLICTEGEHTAPPALVVSLAPAAPIASPVALQRRSRGAGGSYTHLGRSCVEKQPGAGTL